MIEGIDCIIAASVGAGFGVTSCSQNIGAISLTKARIFVVKAVISLKRIHANNLILDATRLLIGRRYFVISP